METRGIVLRVIGAYAEVDVLPASAGCGRCHEAGGCGSHLLNESLRLKKMATYRLPNTIQARAGDAVMIDAAEGAVFRAALWAYFLPVLLLLGGAALGRMLSVNGSEQWALLGAVAGLAVGLLALYCVSSCAARNPVLSMRLADGRDAGMCGGRPDGGVSGT